jgi:replicative DNA helicase
MTALPSLPDDEISFLACCFADHAESFSSGINAGVATHTFTDTRNRAIFSAMASVAASGGAITPESVASTLQARDQVEAAGGWAHIIRASTAEPTTANVQTYIQRIRRTEVLRGVIIEANRLADSCAAVGDSDPSEVIEPAIARLLSISSGLGIEQDATWEQVVDQAATTLAGIIANSTEATKNQIAWPWARMSELFAAMQRGQLVVLAARPSVGKSSLARPIALSAAMAGNPVYFVTLEVSPERVPLQMAASMAGTGLREAARAHRKDQDELKTALKSLKGLGITISKRDRSIARICGRARALKSQGKLDLLIIDHGLLLDDVARAKASENITAISQVTKALKTLAQDLEIVVVLLWQLNRDSAKDENREPNLADLRGSGSLEEDADKVIFIHRPSENPMTGQIQRTSSAVDECPQFFQNVIQAKGRDDGTSLMSFMFRRSTATFTPAIITK